MDSFAFYKEPWGNYGEVEGKRSWMEMPSQVNWLKLRCYSNKGKRDIQIQEIFKKLDQLKLLNASL